MHWNPCESYIAVIQNYNDGILIASVLVDRFNENRNKESSLHNYLWTVLSTSCCNSRSWPMLTTTPRPGSKTTRYLQNMIWEVQSLSAALETWNPGLWLHSGMWSGLWAGWWRPGEGEPGQVTFRWLPGQRSLGMKHFRSRIISRFSPSSMPSLSLSLSQCLVNDKAIFLNNTGLSKFYIWKLFSALKNHQASLASQISHQNSISPPKKGRFDFKKTHLGETWEKTPWAVKLSDFLKSPGNTGKRSCTVDDLSFGPAPVCRRPEADCGGGRRWGPEGMEGMQKLFKHV